MKLAELRTIAKSKGVVPINLFKTELIKTIQAKEGNFDCYATAYNGKCDRMDCLWREDCLEVSWKGELS
jgi:hypothetical protein